MHCSLALVNGVEAWVGDEKRLPKEKGFLYRGHGDFV